MGTTANYSWPTPVAQDLVKDGWEAIKDLGDAADTTVKAVSDAQGLVHINTTAFSGVASQALDGVFNADYDTYRIILSAQSYTGSDNLRMVFRTSGADVTSSDYFSVVRGINTQQTTLFLAGNGAAFAYIGQFNATYPTSLDLTVHFPFASKDTTVSGTGTGMTNNFFLTSYTGVLFDETNSFDGFKIYPAAGNFTGEITVLGVKN